MDPLVSCVMLVTWPARATMIADALLAFQLQRYPRRELVVVNDGEPIADPGVTGVRIVNLPDRRSIGFKRNVGLEHAHGTLVATWDDDDFALPEHLSMRVAMLRASGASFVRASRMWLANAGLYVLGLERGASLATAVYRRIAAIAVGGFPDVSYGEDGGFYARLILGGWGVVTVDLPTYVHRRHASNVTAQKVGESLGAHLWYRLVHADSLEINHQLRQLLATPRLLSLESAAKTLISGSARVG